MKTSHAKIAAGLAAVLFAASGIGCARVVSPAPKSSSEAVHAWGPIAGTIRPTEDTVVIVNHELMAKETQVALSTGTPLKEVRIPQVSATAGRRAAWPKPAVETEANPFHHPAPVNALPEVLPKVSNFEGQPLPDRFDLASVPAALASVGASGTPASSPKPLRGAPTVLTQTTQPAEPRARLAEPVRNIQPLQNAPQQIASTSASLVGGAVEKGGASQYRFSFSSEIWLLVVIIAGVFATLWFRLEYDFGSRSRNRRR